MRKYIWGITAGVCVLALLAAGVIFLPPLIMNHTQPDVSEGHTILMPGHWWKMDMTEQQSDRLRSVWGENMMASQLLQELWPDLLPQIPQEAMAGYEKRQIGWPTETEDGPGKYEEWKGQMICNLMAVPDDGGAIVVCFYLGTYESEEGTFEIAGDRGFTEDRAYRVSIYTGHEKKPA